jgi:hypothetical protein
MSAALPCVDYLPPHTEVMFFSSALAVKKKKMYERAMDQLDKQLMNLRTQIESEMHGDITQAYNSLLGRVYSSISCISRILCEYLTLF